MTNSTSPFTVLITGPESSGKTTLAKHLAWCLDGLFVAEAARDYLNERNGIYTAADLPAIWARQARAEEAARASAASFVVCDTGPEVIRVWSEVKYGKVDSAVLRATSLRRYDLTLLCAPDLPWEPDPLRESPAEEQRSLLFGRYRELIPEAVIIRGDDRTAQAVRAVCLKTGRKRRSIPAVATEIPGR